jgi:hypothetical protein
VSFLGTDRLNRAILGAAALTISAGIANAQIVDNRIPLNYNFHGMAHQGEAITGATANNADFVLYRSISDRGLYWDPGDTHAFGTNPLIGFTGIPYSLYDNLGYTNETVMSPGDASNNGLDIVHLGHRGVYYRLYDTDSTTQVGPFPAWQPDAATNSDHTGDQVTVLGTPIPVDAQTEIGVLYMASDGGGQFDCVLTFNNGGADNNVTVRLAAPDWFGAAADPAVVSGQPVSFQRKITHTVSGTTYTTFRGAANVDSAALQAFATNNAGPNLNVMEGIISVPAIIAGGNNVAGQNLTRIAFRNAAYASRTLTSLICDGTTATGTSSTSASFLPGTIVTVAGATPATLNGTYTVTSLGPTTAISSITSTATVWTVTTATPHGFAAAGNVYMSGNTPAAYNGTFTVATVPNSTTFTINNTTNPGAASTPGNVQNGRVFTYANTTPAGTSTGTRTVVALGRDRGYSVYAVTARTGQPQRANCATAEVVGVGDTPSNNIRCTGAPVSGYGNNDTTAAWYRYTATQTGDIEARTCGAAIDTTIAVLTSCGGTPIAGNDNGGCGTGSRVRWSAVNGLTYLIRISGNNAAIGSYTLHIDDPAHIDITMPLAFNWNGIVHGQNEQTIPDPAGTTFENRCDAFGPGATGPNGYRAIADRGLLCDGTATNALNYGGGAVGYQGMFYSVYGADHQSDMIHLGNRTLAAGGIRNWNVTCPTGSATAAGQNGLRPVWLNNDDQTTPQTSDLSAFGAVFGPNTMLGILYHVSNVDTLSGTTPQPCFFDVTLSFTDSTSVTVPVQATDWFGTNAQVLPGHNNSDGSGLETQRVLGIYHGTQNTDRASDAPTGALKVDEAVISTASLSNVGFSAVGKTLQFITFGNLRSTHLVAGSPVTDSVYSAAGIYSATVRDPQTFNQNFGPTGVANINVNPITVGASARMQVAVSRGGGSPNNITSVTIDATSINQGTIVLNDLGVNGDVNPNDSTWSRTVTFPVNSTPGNAHLPFTVTDAQNRTFSGTLSFVINGPTGTATPPSVAQEGTTLITVPLFPNSGSLPTNIASVSIDASSISSGSLSLNDSGNNGDVTGGDGIWSGTLTVNGGATLGAASLPIIVTDVSSRVSNTGRVALTITAAPTGACCNAGNCSLASNFNCTAGGGVFQGVGTNCGVTSYTISDSANPFNSIAGTGTLATTVSNCDDCSQSVALPFSFTFFDGSYSSVFISSNGNLQFSATASTSFTNDAIPTAAAPNNAIYPMWDDYNTIDTGAPNGQGDVYYTSSGAPPNRTFTVEWNNVTQYTVAGTYPMTSETFQVVLFEGSNNIEFRYGTISPPCNSNAGQCTGIGPDGDDRTVGVEDSTGTAAYVIPGASLGTGNISKLLAYHTAATPCAPTTGSCCTANQCTTTSESDCTTLGGTWTGGGSCPMSCPPHCGSADFNCDGDTGTDQDIEGFFACLAGNCPGLPCISSADFNGDGDTGTDADIEAFFRVLAGGNC